jgi:hypothetical protein
MKAHDREDAMLRSLDILPGGDSAGSDPRFVKNPDLMEEARLTRETAVDVWLAVSPLQVAPPRALDRILAQVRPDAGPKPVRKKIAWPLGFAIGGWAAAAALAFLLIVRPKQPVPVAGSPVVLPQRPDRPSTEPAPANGTRTVPSDRKLQEEIARLKHSLDDQERQGTLPRVRGLSPPGMAEVTPEKARDDLRRMLVDALRSSLEAETGAPGDSAALVIERGWLPEGFPPLQEDQTIRHRHFPEDTWENYGLLKTDENTYYDGSNNLIWARDPDGRGFIGRKVLPSDPIEGGKPESESKKIPPPGSSQLEKLAQSTPSGILIEDPASSSTTAVIEGVKPATDGTSQWAVVSMSTGQSISFQVSSAMFSSSGTLLVPINSSTGFGQLGPYTSGLQNTGVTSFELQTRDTSGSVTATIVQGGH